MVPVSICLVTYNRSAALPKTLESLLAQRFGDFELIISDDYSTDNTEEVCREYQQRDSRVKYFRNTSNLSMPGNLNVAIRRARGTYIANLHDGDVYSPDLIGKWKDALDHINTAVLVFNHYQRLLPDGHLSIFKMPFDGRVAGKEIALHFFRTLTSCVWGAVMIRSSALARAGLFDPTFGFISDVDMWLRLMRYADAAYIPEPLITLGPKEADHPWRRLHWRSAFWTFGMYKRHLETYRGLFPDLESRWRARYALTCRLYFLKNMLSLVKHGRWDRVREGLAMWKDAQDPVLRTLGHCLPHNTWQPAWYDASCWSVATLAEL